MKCTEWLIDNVGGGSGKGKGDQTQKNIMHSLLFLTFLIYFIDYKYLKLINLTDG